VARAANIYIVLNHRDLIVAAFTVKHECGSWLEERVETTDLSEWTVVRLPDGRSAPADETSAPVLSFIHNGFN
jgi:hypothetical protein